jgi:apolipoprotein N-acyltransferase
VGFVAFTGIGGLVLAVAAVQALLASALRGPRRARAMLAAAVIVGVASALSAMRWHRPPGPVVRVAAYGWSATPQELDGNWFLERAAAAAAADGCSLLVTPETSSWVGDREDAVKAFARLASKHRLQLVAGIWHEPTRDNRIWFVAADGALAAEYRKTHLVPFFEDYAAGDGTLAVVPFGASRLGGMICQDDNFTDVARGYGRQGVPIVAVPTNDWPAIREYHLENAIFRAIENGYAVVRATSNGISAIVSARGEVLAREDHVAGGLEARPEANVRRLLVDGEPASQAMLCAEVPLGDGAPTAYARLGDLPIALLCLLLIAAATMCVRRAAAAQQGAAG